MYSAVVLFSRAFQTFLRALEYVNCGEILTVSCHCSFLRIETRNTGTLTGSDQGVSLFDVCTSRMRRNLVASIAMHPCPGSIPLLSIPTIGLQYLPQGESAINLRLLTACKTLLDQSCAGIFSEGRLSHGVRVYEGKHLNAYMLLRKS